MSIEGEAKPFNTHPQSLIDAVIQQYSNDVDVTSVSRIVQRAHPLWHHSDVSVTVGTV